MEVFGEVVSVPEKNTPEAKKDYYIKQGREGGRLGGRPSVEAVVSLSAQAHREVFASNRKVAGSKAKKDETFGLVQRVQFCEWAKRLEAKIPNPEWRMIYMVEATVRTKEQVLWCLAGEEHWKHEVRQLWLGKGTHGSLKVPATARRIA